jgi:hypothetical protein
MLSDGMLKSVRGRVGERRGWFRSSLGRNRGFPLRASRCLPPVVLSPGTRPKYAETACALRNRFASSMTDTNVN